MMFKLLRKGVKDAYFYVDGMYGWCDGVGWVFGVFVAYPSTKGFAWGLV
jgi:hypothetical protein